ncbi:hypothetical protein HA402_002035 [Bradysia odoriphaga]|nr:hypothetical protein HA402_002035 [Bradysia odoriphaga]
MSLEMAETNHSDEKTIDTVLQAAHYLHDRFLEKMKKLQLQAIMAIIRQGQQDTVGLAQIPFQFDSLSEMKHMELDIDSIYDEALQMCNSPADMKILHDFTKVRQQERMVLIRELMDNQIVQIASDDKLAAEMKDFINFVRSLDCPGCRDGGMCGDQEMCGIAVIENAEVPAVGVNQ